MYNFSNTHLFKRLSEKKHIITLKSSVNVNKNEKRKALFFDRDGVIIQDIHYIKNPKDVKLLNGAKELLKYSKFSGWLNIIITNQSGISRSLFNWEDYEKVSKKMLSIINEPNLIDAIYASGEGPKDTSLIIWRKPSPNMIFKASKDFNIQLSKSFIVGDRYTDLLSGEKAGIKNMVHLLTGHGINERENVMDNYFKSNNKYNLSLIDDLSFFPNKKLL